MLAQHVTGTSSKSVLIQTVALFEALLTRIKDLQRDNDNLKDGKNADEEDKRDCLRRNDELVLALEHLNSKQNVLTSEKAEISNQVELLKQENDALRHQLEMNKTASEKKDETHRKVSSMQSKVEEDLRRELSVVNQKLESTIAGHQAESEMYQESLLKVTIKPNCCSLFNKLRFFRASSSLGCTTKLEIGIFYKQ